MKTTRRSFVAKSMLAAAGVAAGNSLIYAHAVKPSLPLASTPGSASISIFSKCLHWLDYSSMAKAVSAMGFDGIDLTVRPEGHVLPERVAEDLPKAVEIIKKAGLKVHMITTAINSADDPFTEPILKTASALGIRNYRTGWFPYEEKVTIEENLKSIQRVLTDLASVNKRYSIWGQYQNHSGYRFGAPVWDLWTVLKGIDSPWMGSQYDVLHGMVEGANSWPLGLKLLKPYVGTLDIKDFQWTKKDGKLVEEVMPVGEGVIDFKKYFALLKEFGIQVPFSMHFEYKLGGAENGAKTITMKKEDVFATIKKDLATFKRMLAEAQG